jgi:hypothetical protein
MVSEQSQPGPAAAPEVASVTPSSVDAQEAPSPESQDSNGFDVTAPLPGILDSFSQESTSQPLRGEYNLMELESSTTLTKLRFIMTERTVAEAGASQSQDWQTDLHHVVGSQSMLSQEISGMMEDKTLDGSAVPDERVFDSVTVKTEDTPGSVQMLRSLRRSQRQPRRPHKFDTDAECKSVSTEEMARKYGLLSQEPEDMEPPARASYDSDTTVSDRFADAYSTSIAPTVSSADTMELMTRSNLGSLLDAISREEKGKYCSYRNDDGPRVRENEEIVLKRLPPPDSPEFEKERKKKKRRLSSQLPLAKSSGSSSKSYDSSPITKNLASYPAVPVNTVPVKYKTRFPDVASFAAPVAAKAAKEHSRKSSSSSHRGLTSAAPAKPKDDREYQAASIAAAELAGRVAADPLLAKELLLQMTLARETPRNPVPIPPRGTIVPKAFTWSHFRPLEAVLKDHMTEYYELSIGQCQSATQQEFNNRLVLLVEKAAKERGWILETSQTDEETDKQLVCKDLRDRIRNYFKTHLQNSKKRLRTLLANPTKRAHVSQWSSLRRHLKEAAVATAARRATEEQDSKTGGGGAV